MSISYHRTACFISLLALVACESDEAKIARLNQDEALARLTFQMYERKSDSVLRQEGRYGPKSAVYGDSLVKAKDKLDLATRNLNKFMR